MKVSVLKFLFMLAIMVLLAPASASASHFRYGQIEWESDGEGTVTYHVRIAERRFNGQVVGSSQQEVFYFGDGNADVIDMTVTSFSGAGDWFIAEGDISHTYSGALSSQAGIFSCCRINGTGGNDLNNRSDQNYNFGVTVDPFTAGSSPHSSISPIIGVPAGSNVIILVPTTDVDGDELNFRFATEGEATGNGGNDNPPNMSINSSTGTITWDNSALNQTNFWTTQVVVEQLDEEGNVTGSEVMDFLLKIQEAGDNTTPEIAVTDESDGTDDGTITAMYGTTITFDVTGSDVDEDDIVEVSTSGIPSGASMSPSLPVAGESPQTSSFSWTPTQAQAGTHFATFIVRDQLGASTQTTVTINVTSNQPPVADAGEDATVECTGSTTYTLDGSGSSDPDGDDLTYSWTDGNGDVVGTTADPTVPVSLGDNTFTLTVDDGNGETDVDEVTITVEDTDGPTITLSGSAIELSAPNHDYRTVNVSNFVTAISDDCNSDLAVSDIVITSVTSDEPENANGNGDGNTIDDIVIASNCKSVQLRAERDGGSNGRVYRIHVIASDGINSTEASFPVSVRKGSGAAVEGSVAYSESGCALPSGKQVIAVATGQYNLSLKENYPNPFNTSTVIPYSVSVNGHVQLSVIDATGSTVAVVVNEVQMPGQYSVLFNSSELPSGTYYYVLESDGQRLVKSMVLSK
jgi:hypothetical protein